MKMQDLKKRDDRASEGLRVLNGAVVQAENFKAEVRQIGDLRYKRTWEAACALLLYLLTSTIVFNGLGHQPTG